VNNEAIAIFVNCRQEGNKFETWKKVYNEIYLSPRALRQMVEAADMLNVTTQNVCCCSHDSYLKVCHDNRHIRGEPELMTGVKHCAQHFLVFRLGLASQ